MKTGKNVPTATSCRRSLDPWLRVLVAAGIFMAGAAALQMWHLFVQRELYYGFEAAGALPPNPVGAMQILGRYIPGPPTWMRLAVGVAGAAVGYGPALLVALLAFDTLTGRPVARCRRCGRVLRKLMSAACPYCAEPL